MEMNISIRMSPEELAILKGIKKHNGNGKKDKLKNAEGETQEFIQELEEKDEGEGEGINYKDFRDEFVEWLYNRINDETAGQYVRDLDRTLLTQEIETPNQLSNLFADTPNHCRIAARNFLKFLIERGYYKASEMLDYQNVIKVDSSSVRTNRFTDTDAILSALQEVNGNKEFMIKLLGYSGLRLSEGILLLNNFNEDDLEFVDGVACYNMEEVMKLKSKSDHNTKNTFDAFFPTYFAEKLEQMNVNQGMFKGDRLAKGIIYANQLRKWNTNYLKMQIREKEINLGIAPETVINYIQGRVSKGILQRHYLDLKQDAIDLYKQIEFPF